MSVKAVSHAFKVTGIPPLEKLILINLADGVDYEIFNGSLWEKDSRELAAFCGATVQEVEGAIRSLAKRGFIQVDLASDMFIYLFKEAA